MPWPSGRKRSDQDRDRISRSLKGKPKSESHRIAMSNGRRGKKRGPYRQRGKG